MEAQGKSDRQKLTTVAFQDDKLISAIEFWASPETSGWQCRYIKPNNASTKKSGAIVVGIGKCGASYQLDPKVVKAFYPGFQAQQRLQKSLQATTGLDQVFSVHAPMVIRKKLNVNT
jgi:hypothetical protein